MGHDQLQKSSSSIVPAIVLVAVLFFAIMGVVVVGLGGLVYVRASKVQAIAHERLAQTHAQLANADAMLVLAREPGVAVVLAPKDVSVMVKLDQLGNASIDGEGFDLDALKTRLESLRQESNSRLSVELNVDPECLFEHVISLIGMCEGMGDIKFHTPPTEE